MHLYWRILMIVMDLETTGLLMPDAIDIAQQPHIIEFGAVKLDNDLNIVDELGFLVNPNQDLPPKITKITGITDADLKDQPPFIAHYEKLIKFFIGEEVMAAHNLPFDANVLKYNLLRMDKLIKFPWPPYHICTVEVGEKVWGTKRKLTDIYLEVTGKEHKGAHRAVDDVKATVEVLRWYKKEGHLDD
jgi:DNA polymerase III epsilon subunit-like protein